MPTEFGQRLIDARERAQLTQVEAAERAGFRSQSTLSQLERGGHRSGRVTQLARAYGVNAHWLATGEGAMAPATPSSSNLSIGKPELKDSRNPAAECHKDTTKAEEIPLSAELTPETLERTGFLLANLLDQMSRVERVTVLNLINEMSQDLDHAQEWATQMANAVQPKKPLFKSPELNKAIKGRGRPEKLIVTPPPRVNP